MSIVDLNALFTSVEALFEGHVNYVMLTLSFDTETGEVVVESIY